MNNKIIVVAIVAILNGGASWAGESQSSPSVQPASALSQQQLSALQKRLDQIERKINNQSLLNMLQQFNQLQADMNKLKGMLEVQVHRLEKLEVSQQGLHRDIDSQLNLIEDRLESDSLSSSSPQSGFTDEDGLDLSLKPTTSVNSALALEDAEQSLSVAPAIPTADTAISGADSALSVAPAIPTTQVLVVETETEALVVEEAVSPQQIEVQYKQVFALLGDAKYEEAIIGFKDFLARYPNVVYSGNAQYWLAEAYYVMSKYNEAITEYEALVRNYPDSPKQAQALLKIGYSYYDLDNPKESAKRLQSLIELYPNTAVAHLAREKLRDIGELNP